MLIPGNKHDNRYTYCLHYLFILLTVIKEIFGFHMFCLLYFRFIYKKKNVESPVMRLTK